MNNKISTFADFKYLCNLNLPLFTFLSDLNIDKITAAREINTTVVNISDRQRTLLQKSALLCLQLVITDRKKERDRIHKELQEVAILMGKLHHELINGDSNIKLSRNMSEKLREIYFEPPLELNSKIRNYLAKIDILLNLQDNQLSIDNPHLQYILNAAEDNLLAGLDAVVSEYQRYCDIEQIGIDLYLLELYNQSQEAAKIAHNKAEEHSLALKELQQAQVQLIHAEKMSSLGQLVAGVAHEINNPVNFIIGNLYYAEDYVNRLLQLVQFYQQEYSHPSPQIQEYLQLSEFDYLIEDFPKVLASMQLGAERISQIVRSLLNFSSLNQGEKDVVDIHDAIENTLLIMQNHFKTNDKHREISIVRDYGCLPMIECYPQELNQVFTNIIKNAIDALQDITVKKPQIRISTYMVAGDSTCNLADSVAIQIADNGAGIAETIQTKIFDPFFTTKQVGQGTGLGLSISYQIIVKKHGGTIDCTSIPGEGTEFFITIPLQTSILPARIQHLV